LLLPISYLANHTVEDGFKFIVFEAVVEVDAAVAEAVWT
jgi:hypothetical protein